MLFIASLLALVTYLSCIWAITFTYCMIGEGNCFQSNGTPHCKDVVTVRSYASKILLHQGTFLIKQMTYPRLKHNITLVRPTNSDPATTPPAILASGAL